MAEPLGVGSVLDDRFRLTSLLGKGMVSAVYEAQDASTGGTVAVKVPLPGYDRDPLYLARLRNEERIGASLDHPSVLRIIPVEKKGRPYLVMEKVGGVPLSTRMREGEALPIDLALRITIEIARALDYLHARRVVHRDLKPSNVMLFPDGSIRLIDLGIAKAGEGAEYEGAAVVQAFGTPDYMPPEQVLGRSGDARSDLYSLGAMLYEMTTGFPPYPDGDLFVVMNARVVGDPAPPRRLNPALSPQVEEMILHALERDPAKRYAGASEFLKDLERPDAIVLTGRVGRLSPPDPRRLFWRRIRGFVWAMAAIMGFFAAMIFVAWMWGGRRGH